MESSIVVLNIVYAVLGAMLTLGFMLIGYLVFDRLTPFETSRQLAQGNVAVGLVVGAIFVALGIAIGLVVGLGLN